MTFINRSRDYYGNQLLTWQVETDGFLNINGRPTPVTPGSTVTLRARFLGPQWDVDPI